MSSAFENYLRGPVSFGSSMDQVQTWTQKNSALSPPNRARRRVFEYLSQRIDFDDDIHEPFSEDEVYVVWYTYIRKSWKALIGTTLPDGMYYEVTYNPDQGETYLDVYKKFDHIVLPD